MRIILISALVAFSAIGSAYAGDVSGKGPNGGRMADAGNMHVEFLTKGSMVAVFTYDHDNKVVSSAGVAGRVTVQEKGATKSVNLTAEAPNKLTGTLEAPLATGARVVLSITPKGGKPAQARFTAE